jgi:hypothetical protein
MTQHVTTQECTRNQVYSGHIVDRGRDLETDYAQIIARCYNRRKDGSFGYCKLSNLTHHDFEVMRRLTTRSGTTVEARSRPHFVAGALPSA